MARVSLLAGTFEEREAFRREFCHTLTHIYYIMSQHYILYNGAYIIQFLDLELANR